MADNDDKGFFDRLGEILNTPLPGTKTASTTPAPAAPGSPQDDDGGLLERIRDILSTPLPGTTVSGGGTPGGAQAAEVAAETQPQTRVPAAQSGAPVPGEAPPRCAGRGPATHSTDGSQRSRPRRGRAERRLVATGLGGIQGPPVRGGSWLRPEAGAGPRQAGRFSRPGATALRRTPATGRGDVPPAPAMEAQCLAPISAGTAVRTASAAPAVCPASQRAARCAHAAWNDAPLDAAGRAHARPDGRTWNASAALDAPPALTPMAPAPPRGMIVAVAMGVSLTPALSQRARGTRSAFGATFTLTIRATQGSGGLRQILRRATFPA